MYIINQGQAAAPLALPQTDSLTRNIFTVATGLPNAGNQLNLPLPGSYRLNGQTFLVRAAGFVTVPAGTTTTAATPIQYVLYGSNSANFVAGSANSLYTSSGVAVFTYASALPVVMPWEIECQFIGANGSTVQNIIGQGKSLVSDPNGITTIQNPPIAIHQLPAFIDFSAEPPIQFAIGVNVNNAKGFSDYIPTGSIATLSEFGILD